MAEALRPMRPAARRAAADRAATAVSAPLLGARPIVARPTDLAGRPAARSLTLPTVPIHVLTMLGLSVAGYGGALALVTGLQATSEAAISADRAPVGSAIDTIAATNDRLDAGLRNAASGYGDAAAGYQAVVDGLGSVEDQLATLARSVKAVDGASRALPASVALPPVVRAVRVATTTTSRATSHATSGGSAAP